MSVQRVRFVGGEADGLVDGVQEITPGVLPGQLECLGSVYRLTEPGDGRPPLYRFVRVAQDFESTVWVSTADTPDADGGESAAELRDQAGRQRDAAAYSRDEAGQRRDLAADHRDRDADLRHHRIGGADPDTQHTWASAAAADRDHSRIDRRVGAADRVEAQHDRRSASADRAAAARDRQQASIDGLTAVHTREAGLVELDRDLARVARTDHRLVLAFVNVDHLKRVNDTHGHAAGDRLLQQVVQTLQAVLRPYDLIIRYGGDEFLCAVTGTDLDAAEPRFARVNTLLGEGGHQWSVTVGLAQWREGESAASLIDRADADLYRQRQHNRP